MAERIGIEALQPGMVILQITRQQGPVKIRKSGLVTSDAMVQGLREMGVVEVEIDPAQTVEVEIPAAPKSQTRQLLETDTSPQNSLDHNLSEQFSRSLFLPSVQELPGVWHYYGKQAATILLLVVGGLSLGWTAATVPSWLPALLSSAPQTPATVQQQAAPQQPPSNADVAVATEAVAQPPPAVDVIPEATEPDDPGVASRSSDEPSATVDADTVDEQAQQQALQGVSPELLKRFEQAVAQVGDATEQTYLAEQKAPSDVPKVHELPAWVLTALPSMTFSAHMYASDPAERWIQVNGQRVAEGQAIADDLYLVEIQPQHVILNYRGQDFSLAALTDW